MGWAYWIRKVFEVGWGQLASFPRRVGVLGRWGGDEVTGNRRKEALRLKGLIEGLSLGVAKRPLCLVKTMMLNTLGWVLAPPWPT